MADGEMQPLIFEAIKEAYQIDMNNLQDGSIEASAFDFVLKIGEFISDLKSEGSENMQNQSGSSGSGPADRDDALNNLLNFEEKVALDNIRENLDKFPLPDDKRVRLHNKVTNAIIKQKAIRERANTN